MGAQTCRQAPRHRPPPALTAWAREAGESGGLERPGRPTRPSFSKNKHRRAGAVPRSASPDITRMGQSASKALYRRLCTTAGAGLGARISDHLRQVPPHKMCKDARPRLAPRGNSTESPRLWRQTCRAYPGLRRDEDNGLPDPRTWEAPTALTSGEGQGRLDSREPQARRESRALGVNRESWGALSHTSTSSLSTK